jgi:light-regulated signal transduction histidine kinase (bacteriophytochrome)
VTGASYRLLSNSLAIRTSVEGKRKTITVPEGSIVTVVNGPIAGRRLVEVLWDAEVILIFADDLQNSEASFFSEGRTRIRATANHVNDTESQGLEQALIEHSMGLATSNEELETFAFIAAHDLRAPLRAIRSMTELFLIRNRHTLDPESLLLLDHVTAGADRMDDLITDLLAFAASNSDEEPSLVEMSHVVALAVEQLQETVDESKVRITMDALPPLMANEGQLMRLFQNLIGNAIKYCKDKPPTIHISATFAEHEVVFSLKDNGIGIDPQYLKRIFDPFQRLHATSEYEGTGIGLAICKRVVNKYGGRIWAESQLGTGSTFCFTLPEAVLLKT